MKKKVLLISFCVLFALSFASCGSSWEVSGNNITITRVSNDTIVPAGTLIIQDTVPQLP